MARALITASAGIFVLLGILHLVMTFFGTALHPRDPTLKARMAEAQAHLTNETTVWRAWLGFNASHSWALLLFGAVYGYLALIRPAVLFDSPFLCGVGFATLLTFLYLAWAFWFSRPLAAVAVALVLFTAGVVVARF